MNILQEIIKRKVELQELISNNKLNEAISKVLDLAKDTQFGNEELKIEAIALSSRYNRIKKIERSGTANFDSINIEHNKLINDLISFTESIVELNQGSKSIELISENKLNYLEARDKFFKKLEDEKENENFDIICLAKGLSKKYKKSNIYALEDVSLEINYKDIIGIVGENASGKSTLIKILIGEIAQTKGTINFPNLKQNKWIKDWTYIKSKIGYVPQQLPDWEGNLLENLIYTASISGIRGKDNDKEVGWMIERLGLSSYLSYNHQELSGGYKMRFELARALIKKPHFLVLDEPLANLDINTQARFLSDLKDISESVVEPLGVIISSQHIHEVESICNKLIFLSAGKAKFNGKFKAIENINHDENVFELITKPVITNPKDFFNSIGINTRPDKNL